MKIYLFLILLFCSGYGFSQNHVPLLKSDSASIKLAVEMAEKMKSKGDLKEESRYYDQLAYLYWEHNYFEQAVNWYEKSLVLNEKLGNQSGVSMINSNLGLIHADLHYYEKSLSFFQKTLNYRKMVKENVGIITTQINISVVLNNLHRYNESAKILEDALAISREMNNIEQMKSCYGMLSETYEKARQSDKAKYYFDLYRTFHEKIQKDKDFKNKKIVEETNIKLKLTESELKLTESEKRNQELALLLTTKELKTKEQELDLADSAQKKLYSNLSKSELKNQLLKRDNMIKDISIQKRAIVSEKQRNWLIFSIVVIILFSFLAVALIIGYREKQKANKLLSRQYTEIENQKNEIEHQKKHLTDSINYAQYIQTAMFKRNAKIESLVSESFIVFKPKDVVSGDFYWFANIDDLIVIVLADCTGHGVPGAFMSMLGMNLLNHIVEYNTITQPDKILHELNKGIRFALSQEENKNRDGMDVGICTIDKKQNKLFYSGAQRPLVMVQNEEVKIISAVRNTVGGMNIRENSEREYELNTFDLVPNMQVYLFSDGFTDQFGKETGKKFSSKRLVELIAANYTLEFSKQKVIFETELENWKQDKVQLDDITMLGVKI